MELTELKTKIIESFNGDEHFLAQALHKIEDDISVYPFNEYEHLFQLLREKGLSFEQYNDIREEYIANNPNLWIFEISAPRVFGERFAQTYIQAKSSNLLKPTKKIDPNFHGEYDLWFEGIKIEVKASRAVDASKNDTPLYIKALSEKTHCKFDMNFQQLKPKYCDVFIWLAVFRDNFIIWVLNSEEVKNHPLYSNQHRDGNEGQIHIKDDNIFSFEEFRLKDNNIEAAIKNAMRRMER